MAGGGVQLQPVVRSDLTDLIVERIRDMILNGAIAPGERLVEATLAGAFETSRGPVRDALARLEQGGLVTIHPRRGTFVTTLSAGDVEEIYTLRTALETLAVERAATRISDEHLTDMRRALDDLAAALEVGDSHGVGEADMRFHRCIVAASGHTRLIAAWEVFADQTRLLMQDLSSARTDIQSASGWHGRILDALAAGDAGSATALMRSHLAAAQQEMVDRFERRLQVTDQIAP